MAPTFKDFILENWQTLVASAGGIIGSVAMFFRGRKHQKSTDKLAEVDALSAIDGLYDKASARMTRLYDEINEINVKLKAKIVDLEDVIAEKEKLIVEQRAVIREQRIIIQRQSRTIEDQKKVITDQQRKLSKYEYKYGKLY